MDLTNAIERKTLAQTILKDIDAYCVKTYDGGHRNHLGASIIGDVCSRKIFNTFRWVKHTTHSGRLYRLFNRGHREEARFIEWLRGIGFQVWELDADTNKQFTFSACMGHFGGSTDGQSAPPERYQIDEPLLLCEFKTQGTGSGFEKLKKDGVAKAKPQHFAQMSILGKMRGLRFAVYCCINKNDDDLHIEIVALDWQLGGELERKADDIIRATIPPEKFAFSEAVFECKYCDFVGLCHRGEQAEKNCRSCINAVAINNAEWHCKLYNNTIPKDFISQGCDSWKSIV